MDFREIKEFLIDTSKYIIVILAILLLVLYVVSLQQVVGDSMSPTLEDADVLLLSKIHYKLFNVKRNDVIAIEYEDSKYLIKRVIGLPGEHIEYKDNVLYINGQGYNETLINVPETPDFNITTLGHETIPEDMYFVIGDNRTNSLDSREIGLISKDEILGKTTMKIWPINEFKLIK